MHQFTKVEMFCVTRGQVEESEAALEMVHRVEREMFTDLGLSFRVLDMCGEELGDPAAEKYDVEAWLPGRSMWGEISSCSNCTDYQARRLDIRDEEGQHCHTGEYHYWSVVSVMYPNVFSEWNSLRHPKNVDCNL